MAGVRRATAYQIAIGHNINKNFLDANLDIEQWLGQLTDKQREVVERRFGLNGHDVSTLEEVGNTIGVTRERVRQIQIEALRKLREILEKEGFSGDALLR